MAVAIGIGLLGLSACGGGSSGADGADNGQLTVVTTTSVYADVVRQVAGDGVEVVALIDSPAQDPHSYEATPKDRLTVQDADLVVLNGGGYDGFMADLTADVDVPVIDAVEVSGLEGAQDTTHQHTATATDRHEPDQHETDQHETDQHEEESGEHAGHDHGSFNEHVWYDVETMGKLSDAVARELGVLDAAGQQTYTDNAAGFQDRLDALHTRVEELQLTGDYVATEPIADYLLEGAGLHDVTPAAFTVAVEDGTDAAPLVYQEVRSMVDDGEVDLVAYNEQTATGQSEDLRGAAEGADVSVVAFSETLPENSDYVQWMGENIDRLETAVGSTAESAARESQR